MVGLGDLNLWQETTTGCLIQNRNECREVGAMKLRVVRYFRPLDGALTTRPTFET